MFSIICSFLMEHSTSSLPSALPWRRYTKGVRVWINTSSIYPMNVNALLFFQFASCSKTFKYRNRKLWHKLIFNCVSLICKLTLKVFVKNTPSDIILCIIKYIIMLPKYFGTKHASVYFIPFWTSIDFISIYTNFCNYYFYFAS